MFPCYTDQFEKRLENSAQIQSSEFEIKNPGRCNPFFFFFDKSAFTMGHLCLRVYVVQTAPADYRTDRADNGKTA